MTTPIGLVLAGGSSRRMGSPKGGLSLDGCSLALRAARVLEPLCRGVLISVRPGADNPAPGYAVVTDEPPPDRGPLAGIDAAFRATEGSDLLVLACDYPRIDTDLLRGLLLLGSADDELVLMADADGRVHPLVGRWRRGVAGAVARALTERRFKVRDLVGLSKAVVLEPGAFPQHDLGRCLINVNSPGDFERLGSD